MERTGASRPILRVCSVGRRFGGFAALTAIDAQVRTGEALAIVGENGAGKSTLLKILSGVLPPTTGRLEWLHHYGAVEPLHLRHARDAADRGIAIVHQEVQTADALDLAGAVLLGREPSRFGVLDRGAMRAEAARWLATVGLDLPPSTPCALLSIAQRQQVEIARALSAQARILILDEPTSSLSAQETDRLLTILEDLKRHGVAVVLVSHRLDEVLRLADRVLVLRDGAVAGHLEGSAIERHTIERLMVGRDLAPAPLQTIDAAARVLLEVRDLVSAHRRRRPSSLVVRSGEIVALAGLVGSGRSELLEAIAGIGQSSGEIRVDGHGLSGPPSARMRQGVAIVPEDRARLGLFPSLCVGSNISMSWLAAGSHRGVVDRAKEQELAATMVHRLRIQPPHPHRRAGTLSGGNQQKAVLGRALAITPRVMLLDEPTRGVDVGARQELHDAVRSAAASGCAVLMASSDLEEVLLLADRILVMHDGQIVGECSAADATEVGIMRLATGGAKEPQP